MRGFSDKYKTIFRISLKITNYKTTIKLITKPKIPHNCCYLSVAGFKKINFMDKKLKKIIDKQFDVDYPKNVENPFVGNMYDIYAKAFESAFKILEKDKQLQLADAQFVGFKEGKWSSIIGLIESMGLSEDEWEKWKKNYPKILDSDDIKEINSYFKDKYSN